MKSLEATSRYTDKSIYINQNEPFLLKCQVAQRKEYSRAKKWDRAKGIALICFSILSVVASLVDTDWLSAISSLLAVGLLVFNKYSEEYIKKLKIHAASIQQYIDATLFSKAIGNNISDWGDVPTQSELADAVCNCPNADPSTMKNWYNDYSSLSGEAQVFYCQRENIRWDNNLLKKFQKFLSRILCAVFVVLMVSFFVANPSFVKLICVLAWFVPIGEAAFSAYNAVEKNIELLQEMGEMGNEIEVKMATNSHQTITRDLIELQCKIRKRRETGFLIPDWFYDLHKERQQQVETKIAGIIQNSENKNGESK